MEYGIRLTDSAAPCPDDPRDLCGPALRALLPEAPVTALYFGTEFCAERLPSRAEALAAMRRAERMGWEAVLLTPPVAPSGLRRVATLLDELSGRGASPSVVFNDWGVLELLRRDHPALPRRMGRLMNRGLRDPRLSPLATAGADTERGSELRRLAARAGVRALESDADLAPGFLGDGAEGMERTLHLPYVFVTSGRNCLEKAAVLPEGEGFVRGLAHPCPRPCRSGAKPERRDDTEQKLWRAGNTIFHEVPPERLMPHLGLADRIVLHAEAMP